MGDESFRIVEGRGGGVGRRPLQRVGLWVGGDRLDDVT